MSDCPLVSVVMPIFNVAHGEHLVWFRQAVESIVNQNYDGSIELVLVDDGSTDLTPQTVLSFKEQLSCPDRKFCYYRLSHVGITSALNHGLGRSEGEFIARLDADDWCVPSRIAKQVKFLQDNPDVGLVGSPVKIIRFTRTTNEIWNVLTSHEQLVLGLREKNRIAHSSVMFRKSVIGIVGNYNPEYQYAQDWDLWWRISRRFRIAQLSEPLTYYRIHNKSISGDGRSIVQNQCAMRIKRAINSGEYQ